MKKPNQLPIQPCSTQELEEALEVLEGRWKILILFHLFTAPVLRFSELRRAMPGISQKMLIQQLRDLERDRVVSRKLYPEVPHKSLIHSANDPCGVLKDTCCLEFRVDH